MSRFSVFDPFQRTRRNPQVLDPSSSSGETSRIENIPIFSPPDTLEKEVARQIKDEKEGFLPHNQDEVSSAVDAVRRILVHGEERRFDRWYDQFKEALRTPESPSWNYLCHENEHKIVGLLDKLKEMSSRERDLFVSIPLEIPPLASAPSALVLIRT